MNEAVNAELDPVMAPPADGLGAVPKTSKLTERRSEPASVTVADTETVSPTFATVGVTTGPPISGGLRSTRYFADAVAEFRAASVAVHPS
jgi:hypothetical protein